jgi:hypothetical protein
MHVAFGSSETLKLTKIPLSIEFFNTQTLISNNDKHKVKT